MKKVFILTIMMLSVTIASFASLSVRPVHKAFSYQQSDGTTIMAYKNGSGFLAFYTSVDDLVLVRNSKGDLCYAKMVDGKLIASEFVAHEKNYRTQEEVNFIQSNNLKPSDTAVQMLAMPNRAPHKAIGSSTSDGLGQYGKSGTGAVNSQGAVTIPVIMVEFADTKFRETTTIEKMTRVYNEQGYHDEPECVGSIKDYFISQSRGMFVPTFDVVAKVTLASGYATYGANDAYGHDIGARKMINEAIAAATGQGVNFGNYTVNGTVPLVCVLYAGQGEATSNDDNTIWPHEMDLPSYNNTISGVKFGSYFVGNELYGNRLMGMGVFTHEFGHALGLPDFYPTNYSYKNDSPYGSWSIMDGGSYVNGTYAPIGYTAYERSCMGWLNIHEMTDNESVTLTNPNDNEGQMAVLFRNPSNNKEYFIFENRQPGTWYPSSFGSGVMLSRIAFYASSWSSNSLNNIQNKKRSMMVTADGSRTDAPSQTQLYGNGVANIETFSLFDGSTYTSAPVYKIIKHNDGTVTLNFKERTLGTEVVNNGMEFEKVTDINTLAAKDSVILVNEEKGMALGYNQAISHRCAVDINIVDNVAYGNNDVQVFEMLKTVSGTGWGFKTDNGYLSVGAGGTLKTGNTASNAITTITFDDGNATITFNGTYSAKTIRYNADDYYFACYQTENSPVQIYRKKASSSGINTIETQSENTVKEGIYTITGQKVNKENMHKGIYIVNGKKVVVK